MALPTATLTARKRRLPKRKRLAFSLCALQCPRRDRRNMGKKVHTACRSILADFTPVDAV